MPLQPGLKEKPFSFSEWFQKKLQTLKLKKILNKFKKWKKKSLTLNQLSDLY